LTDFVAGHSLAALEELAGVIEMRGRPREIGKWYDEGETLGWPPWSHLPQRPTARRASMRCRADGEAVGSVSGGCVEGAVYELAQEVMASGRAVVQRYGVSDDDAFAVGLTCGRHPGHSRGPIGPQTFPLFVRRY